MHFKPEICPFYTCISKNFDAKFHISKLKIPSKNLPTRICGTMSQELCDW